MARTDKNFNEALENVLKTHGHDEAIKFLITHNRSGDEVESYLNETFGNMDDSDAMASDGVNASVQGVFDVDTDTITSSNNIIEHNKEDIGLFGNIKFSKLFGKQ